MTAASGLCVAWESAQPSSTDLPTVAPSWKRTLHKESCWLAYTVEHAFHVHESFNEMPIYQISLKYSASRGALQNLGQTCQGFAAGTVKFCERRGWGMLAAVLVHMVDRLRAEARADRHKIMQLTFVKSRVARVL